ncbi:MAG: FprA family A-type flavoprotein, partial [Actinomycetota bacterium]|nr:FprA family A-type flavoprotein [Actinomycetota bacterium]
YHNGLEIEAVTGDDVIDLGGKTLEFMPAAMVHWPDSMFTYCPEAATLMPNDAFGQHVASEERFADEFGIDGALSELGIYYANILLPLGTAVGKAVAKVVEAGWKLDIVAPSHGLIWRGDDIGRVIDAYARWGAGEKRDKALVVFSTMWGSTETIARSVAEGIATAGVEVEVYDLALSPLAHVTAELLEAKALVLGSPTLHHGMLYRVAGYLQYLSGLKPTDRIAATFGSYGWSKGADKEMRSRLEEIGFELPFEDFLVKFRPTADDLSAAETWGRQIAEAVKAR